MLGLSGGSASSSNLELFNVNDYGAVGDGATNDSAPIQNAIDAARVAGGTIYFPPGAYLVDALDCTNPSGPLMLQGAGGLENVARLVCNSAVNAVIDAVGAKSFRMDGLQIGAFNQTPVPNMAVLIAPSNTVAGMDQVNLSNCHITGKYAVSTLYAYGVASSNMNKMAFWNYQDAAGVYAGIFTRANISGVTSSFATIGTGSFSASDWALLGTEFHEHAKAAGASTAAALRLSGATSMNFFGGNASGSGANLVTIETDGSQECQDINFTGTTFYSENGTAPSTILSLNNGVDGIGFPGCSFQFSSGLLSGSGRLLGKTHNRQYDFRITTGGTVGAGATAYLSPSGNDTTEVNAAFLITQRGVLNTLYGLTTASPGAGQSYTITVRVNAVDTGITFTITEAGTTGSDLTHWHQVSPGDWMTVKIVTSGGANATGGAFSIGFLPY